jgi:hypothetical protein
MPVITGGGASGLITFRIGPSSGAGTHAAAPPPLKLKDAADALLYLGPRDSLTEISMSRAELDGTPYGKEIQRRLTIEGFPNNLGDEKGEAPQFPRPQAESGPPSPPPHLPPPPKNMGAPLPPRPPSQ